MDIPKAYEAKNYEDDIYQRWEASGFFNPDICIKKGVIFKRAETFTIILPPPNVTGELHLGHASMLAYEDLMIRYQRLKGKQTLWLPGTDHAAIATQTKVEKILASEGKSREDLGREKFIARVKQYVNESKDTIHHQIRSMGSSLDWSREKYTLDKDITETVYSVFSKMYKDGLIYRGNRIVNWCPRCHSTLADDEVEYQENKTPFYYFKYGPVVIGTARPETKFADKVIIVHPDDKRYKDLVGKKFNVPWIEGEVEARVIADKIAEPELGTGAMTITPAHSFADFGLAQKYGLEVKKIIDEQGNLTEVAGEFFGMNANKARAKIVKKMKDRGLVDHIDEDYTHNLSVCYRCQTPIEPLPSWQWFIDVNKKIPKQGKSLKELAVKAVRVGFNGKSKNKIEIIPDHFNKTYFHWLENLHDWCISRQIWWGHRIPVWYCGGKRNALATKRMGFHEDVVPQLYKGKTKTFRLRDHGFQIGDKVLFEDSKTKLYFGYGKIIDVKKVKIREIDLQDKTHYATYKSLDELIKAFKLRNPDKKVTPGAVAYLYEYEFHEVNELTDCGQIIVSDDKPASCPVCGNKTLEPEEDTLDTWFSSALWTFSTLGYPKGKDFKRFHPTQVLETGYDIIFFWVARMILMTTYATGEIPFEKVYLHGLVRDKQGKKMSKSLGNGIDPIVMIDKYGADALRLSMIIGTAAGNDIKLYEEKISGYRNFINKLWNISRFILINVDKPEIIYKIPKARTLSDKWILSEFNGLINEVTAQIENFNFSQAGERLYDFTWSKLADWYLEIAKIEGSSNQEILNYILQKLLILWHPFTPFITETIWSQAFNQGKKDVDMLIVQKWPQVKNKDDKQSINDFAKVKELITNIRALRADNKIAPSKVLETKIMTKRLKSLLNQEQLLIESLARVKLELIEKKPASEVIHQAESDYDIYIISDGDTKRQKEKNRKELEKYIRQLEKKLENSEFIDKAPKEVVAKEKDKLKQAQEKQAKLN